MRQDFEPRGRRVGAPKRWTRGWRPASTARSSPSLLSELARRYDLYHQVGSIVRFLAGAGGGGGTVIRRAPRSYVKNEYPHSSKTLSRLRKPARYMMWTSSQVHHASQPLSCRPATTPTAL